MASSLVVIGCSLGGLNALQIVLRGLPRDFGTAIALVQHRGKHPDEALSRLLAACCALPVREPLDKERIEPGHVYVAPADYHLMVERGALALSTEAPVNYARPSIDVLFETAAESYGEGVIAVVLTGANHDGAAGAARIQARGGRVLVQDPNGAESRPMPLAALASTGVIPTPLESIAATLVELC